MNQWHIVDRGGGGGGGGRQTNGLATERDYDNLYALTSFPISVLAEIDNVYIDEKISRTVRRAEM